MKQVIEKAKEFLCAGYSDPSDIHFYIGEARRIVRELIFELGRSEADKEKLLGVIRGRCRFCVKGERPNDFRRNSTARTCAFLRDRGIVATTGQRGCKHWEWNGSDGMEDVHPIHEDLKGKVFIDGFCPNCGNECGNNGSGPLRCTCGWIGEDTAIDKINKAFDEAFPESENEQ